MEADIQSTNVVLIADAIVILALLAAMRYLRRYDAVYILLVLPGTILHEFSHWLIGLFTNARPQSFSIIPKRSAEGWVLGSVSFTNIRWYNGVFVGLAPLLLFPAAVGTYVDHVNPAPLLTLQHWLLLHMVAIKLISAAPSKADLHIAWAAGKWLAVVAVVVCAISYLVLPTIRATLVPIFEHLRHFDLPEMPEMPGLHIWQTR